MERDQPPLSEQNERIVQEYFEKRPDWTVTKLDLGKERAADFRICHDDNCFLCEVKTIHSVRADIPYAPVEDYFVEVRDRRRAEIERLQEADPDKRWLLHKGEREFIYSDEIEFRERYRGRTRNTEAQFKKFAKRMEDYFAKSSISHLPYGLRLDSQDLYIPTPSERHSFFKWLEEEIRRIDRGKPSRDWVVEERRRLDQPSRYSTFYRIHKSERDGDPESTIQLMVTGPLKNGNLQLEIHYYGTLNLDAITRNVEDGLQQLQSSAERESDQRIARVIVLAFGTGIGFEWGQLSDHIAWLLEKNPNLSAIAVLKWVPNGTPPPEKDGFLAWFRFQVSTPSVPSFVVFHNSWLQDIKSLEVSEFSDPRLLQCLPMK